MGCNCRGGGTTPGIRYQVNLGPSAGGVQAETYERADQALKAISDAGSPPGATFKAVRA